MNDNSYPNITVQIGVCSVDYSKYSNIHGAESVTVNVNCPSVELLTAFNKCQMTIKQQHNVKFHNESYNRLTTIITEPEDGTQMTITRNLFGSIVKATVGPSNISYTNNKPIYYNMLWSLYYYSHRIHHSNPILSVPLSTVLAQQ